MNAAAKAVFLSYASQDAEAARRICEALRAASVEVWFSRLRRAVVQGWLMPLARQMGDSRLASLGRGFEFRVWSWETTSR